MVELNQASSDPFTIPISIWLAMRADVISRLPEEACGILGGFEGRAAHWVPVENQYHSPERFKMDPQAQWNAFKQLEELGLEFVAVYHSHPLGPSTLSQTDINEAYYPDILHIIWVFVAGEWQARAFRISNGNAHETSLFISN